MAEHRAQDVPHIDAAAAVDHGGAVWIARGRPDPFRAPGVPDRLVLVLNREGLHYVGKLVTWEYREIEVRRGDGTRGPAGTRREMVVDVSLPHEIPLLVQMRQRPTAARLVAELVDVLKACIGPLAGRDRRMPPGPARPPRLDIRS
jgi:hypothetical protein